MKRIAILTGLALALLSAAAVTAGCTNWEKTTYQALSASKATLDQAQADYESGKLPKTRAAYSAITEAKNAQTLAVNAMIAYEEAKAAGASSTTQLAAAQAAVQSALNALPTLIADVKALYSGVK